MEKEKFVDTYLDKLIRKDKDIRDHFKELDSDEKKELFTSILRKQLEDAYETYAKEYFDSEGLGSYVSTALRWGGAGANLLGTYTFWSAGLTGMIYMAAPASFAKLVGFGANMGADSLDEVRYEKHKKTDLSDRVRDTTLIVGEGTLERAAAYSPFVVGEAIDFLRGRSKFDSKITGDAVYFAKKGFLDYISEDRDPDKLKLLSRDYFINPTYADLESRAGKTTLAP